MKKYLLLIILLLTIISISNRNTIITKEKKTYLEPNNTTMVEYLKSKANDETIQDYLAGNTKEMYVFNHDATDQVDANKDYRYIGPNPNNYIYFNCTDENDTSTCETWRIIGIFEVEDENGNKEERIKIAHDTTIGKIPFDVNNNNNNNFAESTIKDYLNNGEYYNSIGEKYKNMIATTKYYLGGTNLYNINADDYYSIERNSTNGYGSWVGNIGLLYPSDFAYIYGHGVESCNDLIECTKAESNWMVNNSDFYYDSTYGNDSTFILVTRLITPLANYSVYYIQSGGAISGGYNGPGQYGVLSFENFIKPTLYLKNNIYINSGEGTLENPYKLIDEQDKDKQDKDKDKQDEEVKPVPQNDINNNNTIDNPETVDNIIQYMFIAFISLVILILIIKVRKNREYLK